MRWELPTTIAIEAIGFGVQIVFPDLPRWVGIAIMIVGILPLAWLGFRTIRAGNAVKWLPVWLNDPKVSLLDRISLIEFRDIAVSQGWNFVDPSLEILDLAAALRQAGADGTLKFWGREDRNQFERLNRDEPLYPIQLDHWSDYNIGATEWLDATDNFYVNTQSMRLGGIGYWDIHVGSAATGKWLKEEAEQFKGQNRD